jgi:hypothetical protein
MMNPKFRFLYLLIAIAGLAFLIYRIIDTFSDIDPLDTLLISLADMLFFYLAYKTYPDPQPVKQRSR